jgi:hypothetical protein
MIVISLNSQRVVTGVCYAAIPESSGVKYWVSMGRMVSMVWTILGVGYRIPLFKDAKFGNSVIIAGFCNYWIFLNNYRNNYWATLPAKFSQDCLPLTFIILILFDLDAKKAYLRLFLILTVIVLASWKFLVSQILKVFSALLLATWKCHDFKEYKWWGSGFGTLGLG